MSPTLAPTTSHLRARRRLMAVGAVAAGLSVVGVGAGTAMAVAPTAAVSRAVASALHGAGVDWSSMPAGYTRAQYEAFWGAGYTAGDVDTLNALWSSESTETKAQAGQMILDGTALPITPSVAEDPGTTGSPSTVDYTQAQADAFWGAGYTDTDLQQLDTLWNSDSTETKARAGQLLLDGQTPPVAPSGSPITGTAS